MAFERMRVFTGNANPKLAEAVVRHLNISLGRCIVGRFSDGEVMVELLENVRGRDVFILQSTCAADQRQPDGNPGDGRCAEARVRRAHHRRDSLLRLRAPGPPTAVARACRSPPRSSPTCSTTVGRQSRADDGPARRPDPGLFQHPGRQHLRDARCCWATCGSRTTTTCSSFRPTSAAWCARGRSPSGSTPTWRSSTSAVRRPNVAEVMNIIGDVEGRTCVIMDDIVDTANTLCKAAAALKDNGAQKVLAYCTHPVLSGGAVARIAEFGARRDRGDRHDPAVRQKRAPASASGSCPARNCLPRR